MDLAAGRGKRAREEEQGAPMPMAPLRARRSNPRRVAAPAPALPADLHDAIQFVLAVRREFAGEPPGNKYEQFLAVLREYDSVGLAAVVDRVKVLFAEHPDLLRGFNRFLPKGSILLSPGRTSRDGDQTAGN